MGPTPPRLQSLPPNRDCLLVMWPDLAHSKDVRLSPSVSSGILHAGDTYMITHAKVKQIQKHGKKALAPPAPISPASRASCLALTGPIGTSGLRIGRNDEKCILPRFSARVRVRINCTVCLPVAVAMFFYFSVYSQNCTVKHKLEASHR